jgi:hypothetical protein
MRAWGKLIGDILNGTVTYLELFLIDEGVVYPVDV